MSITSIDYETYIPQSSSIVGKNVGEIEAQSGLKIDHCRDSFLTRKIFNKKVILKPGMYIKICDADHKKLASFRECFKLP